MVAIVETPRGKCAEMPDAWRYICRRSAEVQCAESPRPACVRTIVHSRWASGKACTAANEPNAHCKSQAAEVGSALVATNPVKFDWG